MPSTEDDARDRALDGEVDRHLLLPLLLLLLLLLSDRGNEARPLRDLGSRNGGGGGGS